MTNYQVPPTSTHQYPEALKNHVTVHKDMYTVVFYSEDKSIGMSISML